MNWGTPILPITPIVPKKTNTWNDNDTNTTGIDVVVSAPAKKSGNEMYMLGAALIILLLLLSNGRK